MTIAPHHVAGVTLLGGLSVGGYFAINAVTPPTLENKLRDLGLTVLTSGWNTKEDEYKTANDDLISSITKDESKNTFPNFAKELENWCNKWKAKSFGGDTDPNYKKFSRWCTSTSQISVVLKNRGLTDLTEEQIKANFSTYNQAPESDKFVQEPINSSKKLTDEDLFNFCTQKKAVNYKYESDPVVKKVIKWCYEKA